MRFTVHRPPYGEVSLCWHRPSGGNIAGCIHVGVARARFAGDAREDRLALAVFGRDVPARGASLRRVRSWDAFGSARGLMVETGNQPAPPLTTNRPIEVPFLRDPNTRMFNRAARRAHHRPHVKVLHPNRAEPARQIGGGLFDPVASAIGFARFESGDRQFGARSAVGATLGAREALLQAAQPSLLTRCKAGGVQQLSGRQCRRHRHTAIDTDHAGIPRARDRAGDVREGDMPAPGPIPSDAIRLNTRGNASCPAEAHPPDLGHQHPSVAPVELLDMARLDPNLPKALMHAGLAPRGTPMGASEEILHGLGEVPQRLLLDGLRPGRQPIVFGTNLSQLGRLLVVPRGAPTRLPQLLLLHGQVPHEPRMPTMLHQRHLLSPRGRQPEPRHTRKVDAATDTNGDGKTVCGDQRFEPHQCPAFQPKES